MVPRSILHHIVRMQSQGHPCLTTLLPDHSSTPNTWSQYRQANIGQLNNHRRHSAGHHGPPFLVGIHCMILLFPQRSAPPSIPHMMCWGLRHCLPFPPGTQCNGWRHSLRKYRARIHHKSCLDHCPCPHVLLHTTCIWWNQLDCADQLDTAHIPLWHLGQCQPCLLHTLGT